MTRRKFTSKFKPKVVLEVLKGRSTLSELSQKYEIAPQQLSTWKRDFLDGAEQVFEGKRKSKKQESEEEKDGLLKIIGQLKVENDFLDKALR